MLKHFAVYNVQTHEVDDPGNVGPIDDAVTEKVFNLIDGKEKEVGEINLVEQRSMMLCRECVGRGSLDGEWKVYVGDVPFSWDAVLPKKEGE